MFICPTCHKEFLTEEQIVKHSSVCWKETHPGHKSIPAPRSKDIMTRETDNDITNFFNSFSKGV